MYRESQSAVKNREEKGPNIVGRFLHGLFLFTYFMILPALVMLLVSWPVYFLTANNFFQESWMMPALVLFSTFIGGAFIRQKMEDEDGSMGLFMLSILALLAFTLLIYHDIHGVGAYYGRFLPKLLPYRLSDYVLLLPGTGVVGMLCYKYFTLKNYG